MIRVEKGVEQGEKRREGKSKKERNRRGVEGEKRGGERKRGSGREISVIWHNVPTRILRSSSEGSSAANPVYSSSKTTPKLYTSVFGVSFLFLRNSGAM